jgi:hypothetical protein
MFKVEIPHQVGERLNTVGETIEHLLTRLGQCGDISNIRVEAAITHQQWAEMLEIRRQVFNVECGFSAKPLPGPGETGVWHFLARDKHDAIGALSAVDTTKDHQLHQRYHLRFAANDRVIRYTQLAILKPYRNRGIFPMLLEAAQKAVVCPNAFTVGWLLYPGQHTRSSMLTRSLGFNTEASQFTTEFGRCHVLVRRESAWPKINASENARPVIATHST